MMDSEKTNYPVVCFGETLWDFLPEGKLPGGAPVNVAYHLKKLGKNPAVITRIGDDELGKELKQVYKSKNIETGFFQVDKKHPTGKVFAEVKDNHEVEYEIVKPVAWDFIEFVPEMEPIISAANYFVFGSLASRDEITRKTLFRNLGFAQTKVLDINLRAPHFSKEILEELLSKADIIKLNLSELHLISDWLGEKFASEEERIKSVSQKYNIETIIITKGGDGAMLFINNKFYYHPGYRVKVADTIGSGDSFLAAMVSKFIDGASPEEALDFASALGAFVASRSGACPDYEIADVLQLMKK
ncbi:MAG: carbohydrate kinase [Ginsengibacter sp.]